MSGRLFVYLVEYLELAGTAVVINVPGMFLSIPGQIMTAIATVNPIVAIGLLLIGAVIGSLKSRHLGRFLSRGDAWRAHQFRQMELYADKVNLQKSSPEDIVTLIENQYDSTETFPTKDRYEDFVATLYESVYGDRDKENSPEEQMQSIQEDRERLTLDQGGNKSLQQLVTNVRSDHDAFETDTSTLVAEFFVTLEKYLRYPDSIDDQEMKDLLHRVGKSLAEDDGLLGEFETLQDTLHGYDYETNSIPNDPQWEDLYNDLTRDNRSELTNEVRTLVSILRMYERELSAIRAFQTELSDQTDLFDAFRSHLDESWIEDQVNTDEDHHLVVAAREGVVGPRIISTVASTLTTEEAMDDTQLIETLAAASVESEEEIESQLRQTVDSLREYETVRLQLEGVDHGSLAARVAEVHEDLDSMSSPVRSKVISEHIDQLSEEIDRISPTNRLELYAISTQLDYLEWAVQNLDEEDDLGPLNDIVADVDKKREEVEEILTPGNYDINTGHNITREFVDLADEFRHEAEEAMEAGDGTRAKVLLVTSKRLLETVEGLYKNTQLRQWLQHV